MPGSPGCPAPCSRSARASRCRPPSPIPVAIPMPISKTSSYRRNQWSSSARIRSSISSPMRTARSAWSSCGIGSPKKTMTASPTYLSSVPPCSNTMLGHLREVVVQLVDELFGLHPLGGGREAPDVGEERREELAARPERDVLRRRRRSSRRVSATGSACRRDARSSSATFVVDRLLQVVVERMEVLVERGQVAGRAVEVLREVAELVAVGHVDAGVEVTLCDLLQRRVDAAHRSDQRPRQDRAQASARSAG